MTSSVLFGEADDLGSATAENSYAVSRLPHDEALDEALRELFAESGTAPAPSLVLNQDGQTYKAQRIAEESKP